MLLCSQNRELWLYQSSFACSRLRSFRSTFRLVSLSDSHQSYRLEVFESLTNFVRHYYLSSQIFPLNFNQKAPCRLAIRQELDLTWCMNLDWRERVIVLYHRRKMWPLWSVPLWKSRSPKFFPLILPLRSFLDKASLGMTFSCQFIPLFETFACSWLRIPRFA